MKICKYFEGSTSPTQSEFVRYLLEKHFNAGEPTPSGVYIRYDVSTKEGIKNLYCVNWPKAFFLSSIRPNGCEDGKELKYLLKKISDYHFPKVAEAKFANTVAFFKESAGRLTGIET